MSWHDLKRQVSEIPEPDNNTIATALREYAARLEGGSPTALEDFANFANAFVASYLMSRVQLLTYEVSRLKGEQ